MKAIHSKDLNYNESPINEEFQAPQTDVKLSSGEESESRSRQAIYMFNYTKLIFSVRMPCNFNFLRFSSLILLCYNEPYILH